MLMGASLAAIMGISMITLAAANGFPREGYVDITGATFGDESSITLDERVKEIPAKRALDVITFWAIPIEDQIGSGDINVAAVTIHHGVNDHQYVGSLDDDPNTPNQDVRSTPVQSFHPHYAGFNGTVGPTFGCLVGLESPKIDFRVKGDTITLDTSDVTIAAEVALTGTIGPRAECTATGLGITAFDDEWPEP
jgi:hypothetical protein